MWILIVMVERIVPFAIVFSSWLVFKAAVAGDTIIDIIIWVVEVYLVRVLDGEHDHMESTSLIYIIIVKIM